MTSECCYVVHTGYGSEWTVCGGNVSLAFKNMTNNAGTKGKTSASISISRSIKTALVDMKIWR